VRGRASHLRPAGAAVKPTIAALNGHAFGGGLELAAACDIRVIAPGATIALPEAGVGIVPGWSGTQRLARLLPEGMLKEMALFGRRIGAERLLAAALCRDPTTPAPRNQIAGKVATLSPRATEIAKAMIHAGQWAKTALP
jgi:enoyl-CoA hydratase